MSVRGPDDRSDLLGRALIELIRQPGDRRDDPVVLLEDVTPESLVRLANHHRVPGLVFQALRTLGPVDDGFTPLRSSYQMATLHHARCVDELRSLSARLRGLDRPWLVVKGPVLVELAYKDGGARLYEDLDLLVAPALISGVLADMEASGGRLHDLNWPLVTSPLRAEIPVVLPRGLLCDLHWDLLVTPNIRSRFDLPMVELVERRRTVRIADLEVDTLDVVDGLLYLCLHGVLSGANQLVWVTDLDRMVRAQAVDWDEFVRRARRHGVDLVAAMLLERAHTLVALPVPGEVLDTLGGGKPWWELWRRHEHRAGLGRWGRTDRSARTYLAATSSGTWSSMLQFGRSLISDVVQPALVERRARPRDAGADVPELYRPVGGDAGRSGYLEMVRGRDGW